MSTPELPPKAGFVVNMGRGEGWDVDGDSGALAAGCDVYTAEQMLEMYRTGLEDAAKVCESRMPEVAAAIRALK